MESTKIFIAYSRKDEAYLKDLRTYLRPIERNHSIKTWSDENILAGKPWEKEIKDNLYAADIILLLVSANSLASDYFYEKEMADALVRHDKGEAVVIPVILSHCAWEITELKELQALPKDGVPISKWQDKSEAYTNIVLKLQENIEEVLEKKAEEQAENQQKKREEAEELQRQKDAAEEQKRLKAKKLIAAKAKERKRLEAEAKRKAAQEKERRRQIQLQEERAALEKEQAEAEQKRKTVFKQNLLEGDKALFHQKWETAIDAFNESLQCYREGDHPNKNHILQKIQTAKEERRKEKLIALKQNPTTRYAAMGTGILMFLFLLFWGINSLSTDTLKEKIPPLKGARGMLDTTRYKDFFNKAQVLFDKGFYGKAIIKLDSALVYQPNDSKGTNLKKEALKKQKEQGIEEEKKRETAAYKNYLNKADQKLKQEKWMAAKSDYEEALGLKPNEPYPKNQLQKIKVKLEEIEKDNTAKKEATERENNYNRWVNSADTKYNQEDWEAAKEDYQEAAKYKSTKHVKDQIAAIDWRLKEEEEKTKLHPEIQKLVNDMVVVEGGTFQMGSDYISDAFPHKVTLSDYSIGKYEVTQAQWKAVMGRNPSAKSEGCNDCPVETVNWEDTQEFIQKLNQLTGKKFRLPTEAEWEFAAKGGIKSQGYKYAGSNNVDEVAWYWKNSGDKILSGNWSSDKILNNNCKTKPVGELMANELGLYDMSGNVFEWCLDWYDSDYYKNSPSSNPQGPNSGSRRVLRGGSWPYKVYYCRSTIRNDYVTPTNRVNVIGFRCAKTP